MLSYNYLSAQINVMAYGTSADNKLGLEWILANRDYLVFLFQVLRSSWHACHRGAFKVNARSAFRYR